MMYVYGKNVVEELLKSKQTIHEVYLTKEFNDQTILNELNKLRITLKYVEKKYADELVDNNSQGIVMKIDDFKYCDLDFLIKKTKNNENALIVILDQITDVHNFASIIRVCECVGADGIIIPSNRNAVVNSATYKISSGAIFNVDICMVTNISQTFKKLKDNNYWIIGSDLATDVDYASIDYNMKVGLVIGSEGKGIRENTRKNCDILVKIPMKGSTSSLNASVAAGILTYQIFNNRRER